MPGDLRPSRFPGAWRNGEDAPELPRRSDNCLHACAARAGNGALALVFDSPGGLRAAHLPEFRHADHASQPCPFPVVAPGCAQQAHGSVVHAPARAPRLPVSRSAHRQPPSLRQWAAGPHAHVVVRNGKHTHGLRDAPVQLRVRDGAVGSASPYDHSRNFTGAVNVLCFNIGLHTAHHMEPGAHWSNLSAVHARLAPRISPAFIETSVWGYCFRAWFTRRAPVTSP